MERKVQASCREDGDGDRNWDVEDRERMRGAGGEDGKMKAVGVNPAPIKADSITL